MKNQASLALFVSAFVILASKHVYASSDQYICRSTCVVIDAQKGTVYPLGSVKGLSEISMDEGFEVMQQACRNMAASHGFNPAAMSLIRGATRVAGQHRQESVVSQGQQQSFKLGWGGNFSRSRSSNSSQRSSTENGFDYQINFADESACGPFKSNPNGNPKYIGSETPLG